MVPKIKIVFCFQEMSINGIVGFLSRQLYFLSMILLLIKLNDYLIVGFFNLSLQKFRENQPNGKFCS